MRKGLFVLSLSLGAAFASAQSFNIDFTVNGAGTIYGSAPSSTYGAAGQAGFWNTVHQFSANASLLDLTGASTSTLFTTNTWSSAGWDGNQFAWVTGDDHLLFEDRIDNGSFSLAGLDPGTYEIILYGFHPVFGVGSSYTINGVTQSVTGVSTSNALIEGETHTIFSGINVTSGLSVSYNGSVAGMQIRQVSAEAVPEPFTMTLLGAGALVAYRRKRKAKQA